MRLEGMPVGIRCFSIRESHAEDAIQSPTDVSHACEVLCGKPALDWDGNFFAACPSIKRVCRKTKRCLESRFVWLGSKSTALQFNRSCHRKWRIRSRWKMFKPV